MTSSSEMGHDRSARDEKLQRLRQGMKDLHMEGERLERHLSGLKDAMRGIEFHLRQNLKHRDELWPPADAGKSKRPDCDERTE